MASGRPTMLMILDGWGCREEAADNAVRQARTPHFDRLWQTCPHALLATSGLDVGLPEGQMGNSEVGHLNLGAGRVVMQDLPRIDRAVGDGSLAAALARSGLAARLRTSGGVCHLLGLVSPGGVHSHQDHAAAVAQMLAGEGIGVRVHAFTDGRDTPPAAAAGYVARLEQALPRGARIATVIGRYYAMDRDRRWERTAQAYAAIVDAAGPRFATAEAAIAAGYARGITDEFLPAAVIGDYAGLRSGDAVLGFNFRADRIRQLLHALLDDDFAGFDRSRRPELAMAVGLTSYGAALDPLMRTLFPPETLANGLGEVLAAHGLRQLRMAETEKYPHVTYFFNGGREAPLAGEDRILVPSPKVATYDLQPEMSAPELTSEAVAAIRSGEYDFILLNYANPDMVGHTGSLPAAIAAVEAVDNGLGRIADALRAADGTLLVTADHGNCELMRDPITGGPHTAHTTNPVPIVLVGADAPALKPGRLADVAPTVLDLMGIPEPAEMTGVSLLDRSGPAPGGG